MRNPYLVLNPTMNSPRRAAAVIALAGTGISAAGFSLTARRSLAAAIAAALNLTPAQAVLGAASSSSPAPAARGALVLAHAPPVGLPPPPPPPPLGAGRLLRSTHSISAVPPPLPLPSIRGPGAAIPQKPEQPHRRAAVHPRTFVAASAVARSALVPIVPTLTLLRQAARMPGGAGAASHRQLADAQLLCAPRACQPNPAFCLTAPLLYNACANDNTANLGALSALHISSPITGEAAACLHSCQT